MANEWDIVIRKVNNALKTDKAVRTGINTVLALQKQRIFVGGKDGQESQIGQYSTKPISISKDKQSRNTGQTRFPGGYAEYKTKIGKNPGYVNLQNTSQMMMDYSFHVLGNDAYGLGFNNEENYKKSKWAEEKYNKEIFFQSDRESKVLTQVIEQTIGNDLK
jgi:hypothetical protein